MNYNVLMTLFLNTFQKEIRSRTLLFFTFLSILTILGINAFFSVIGNLFDPTLLSNMGETKLNILYYIVSVWGGFLSMMLGVNCLKSDMSYGVAQQIMTFPIRGDLYQLTRIFGTWIIVNVYYILTFVAALVVFSLSDGAFHLGFNLIISFVFFSLIILVCITLASLVSMFFSKTTALIIAIMAYSIIQVCNSHVLGLADFHHADIFSVTGIIVHYVFPRLGVLNSLSNGFFMNRTISLHLGFQLIHFVFSYTVLFYTLFYFFRKTDYQV